MYAGRSRLHHTTLQAGLLITARDCGLTDEFTPLYRIPEIGLRMFQQGALPVLEKGLNTLTGHGNLAVSSEKDNLTTIK